MKVGLENRRIGPLCRRELHSNWGWLFPGGAAYLAAKSDLDLFRKIITFSPAKTHSWNFWQRKSLVRKQKLFREISFFKTRLRNGQGHFSFLLAIHICSCFILHFSIHHAVSLEGDDDQW